VILFKDYLQKDINTSAELPNSDTTHPKSDSIVDFPPQDTSKECSREEIGKWVDKLMSMPDEAVALHGSSDLVEDPFLAVASKIWDEEIS
jgi:hypothetical protein